ncbi:MAG: marine proteobacterial sortase target protein [Burkholderiaceae bacterium]
MPTAHPIPEPATITTSPSAPAQAFAPGHWRDWLKLLLEAIATSLGIALALGLSVMLGASVARAAAPANLTQQESTQVPVRVQAPDGAALLFKTEKGYVTAPLQRSDVKLQVTGHIVRARVTQTYRNPNPAWIHGTYQFPLPDDSAVDTLEMQVGGRIIVGEIQPRQQARKVFEQAKTSGKRATIIEQQRPNVFTAGVANIAPESDITINIEYQQVLSLDRRGWSLRFPTVVAPRYTPPSIGEHGFHTIGTLNQETAHRTRTQPTLLERDERHNRLSLSVSIHAGLPVSTPSSSTHDIAVTTIGGNQDTKDDEKQSASTYEVSLRSEALADRDFELRWSPEPTSEPMAGLQLEQHGADWYGLLTVAPPTATPDTVITKPREILLILDTSGSMHGTLDDAKKAVMFALDTLKPSDRFNLIEFNSEHTELFSRSRQATANNLRIAKRFVRSLRANGGTEMRDALMAALKTSIPADYFSQVVFVTDGAVSNEAELFSLIDTMLGERKLFTVGIGTAPNRYFMRQAAASGRGSHTLINGGNDIIPQMTLLFERLSSPMMTHLQLRDDAGELIDTGRPIRDLYAGEPVVMAFRLPIKPTSLVIEGEQNEFGWQQNVPVQTVTQRGIDKLWARDQLQSLDNEIRRFSMDGRDPARLREQATDVAMNHHLVSAYTSLVAVDATPARLPDAPAHETAVPRHLPKGFSAAAVGRAGQTLASTNNGLIWQLVTGAILLLLATTFVAIGLFRAQSLLNPHQASRQDV